MRHIPLGDLLPSRLSDDWQARAREALRQLVTLPASERAKYFKDNSVLWSELKGKLAALSNGKCWYSEADVPLPELHVDHFRPKGRVLKTDPPHAGYWWLAFDWSNFRLASPLVNKRTTDEREGDAQGKGSYFPLLDENQRVYESQVPPRSFVRERPVLIDPTVVGDVQLLSYAVEEGKIVEAHTTGDGYTRAHASIGYYHLNDGTLIRQRQDLQVMLNLRADKLEELEAVRDERDWTPEESSSYDEAFSYLSRLLNRHSPFSTFARSSIQQRGTRGWTEVLLRVA